MEAGAKAGLQDWIRRIRDRDMPVFGRTVQEVRSVTEDERAPAALLASVILRDAALTTKLLKLANSVLFNPSRQRVSTVSRAIVVLGFDLVGKIVLSIHLVDALLAGGRRERVVAEMARCFHAAVQARSAALARESRQPEEVFIATLLGRVGEIAFWCFGAHQADALDAALTAQPEARAEDLQRDTLGFTLRSLSVSLAREWQLGPLVAAAAAAEPRSGSVEESAIALGYQLARAVEEGWQTPRAKAAVADYTSFCARPGTETLGELSHNAAEAARVAAFFGAEAAARLIPVPPEGGWVDIDAELAEPPATDPDPLLQLQILRDLSMLLAEKPSPHEVLQLTLEGIHRGLGLQRAAFALVSPDRSRLLGRLALGHDAEQLAAKWNLALDARSDELFNALVQRAEPLWLRAGAPCALDTSRLEALTGRREGMLAPIRASGRVVGVFFADWNRARPAEDDAWQGFLHFAQQAGLALEHVAARAAVRP